MTKFKYYNLGTFMGNIDFEEPESKILDRDKGEYVSDLQIDEVARMTGLPVNPLCDIYGYFRKRNLLVNDQDGRVSTPKHEFQKLDDKEERFFPTEEHIEIYLEINRQFPIALVVYRGSLIGFIIANRKDVHYIIRDTFQKPIPLDCIFWEDNPSSFLLPVES